MQLIKLVFGLTFLLLISPVVNAQRPVLTDEEVVAETVTKEIDELFSRPNSLKRKPKNMPM